MEKNKINEPGINTVESKRIADVKSMSYLERLERLMITIEVSYTLRIANEIPFKRNKSLL
jgi:hypothetical protein